MITAITAVGAPEPLADPRLQAEPARVQAAPPQPTPDSDMRLTIDVAPKGSELVYTLTDRTTGRVVVQLPRAAVQELGSRPGYAAGDLIGAKA